MCELRAACAFADCPDAASGSFQTLVDPDEPASVDFYACLFQPDAGRVWNSSNRNK
jgi:hypothetical protein